MRQIRKAHDTIALLLYLGTCKNLVGCTLTNLVCTLSDQDIRVLYCTLSLSVLYSLLSVLVLLAFRPAASTTVLEILSSCTSTSNVLSAVVGPYSSRLSGRLLAVLVLSGTLFQYSGLLIVSY